MTDFMPDDFLLTSKTARKLYSAVADLPIFDYHCHLNPQEIFDDRAFYNLAELWLEGDHYKWRVMREAGVDERLITGDAPARDKFFAFASVLPEFAGNPVYHWAHMELKKYFGINVPLSADTAAGVWDKTLAAMADGSYSARRLIETSGVKAVVTTDDPLDDLDKHEKLAAAKLPFAVLPCFRCDNVVNIDKDGFADYVHRLADKTGRKINCVDDLLAALAERLDVFKAHGAVAADCSFTDFRGGLLTPAAADCALRKKMKGRGISADESAEYSFRVLVGLARLFAERGMVMQIHTGVLRNRNSVLFGRLGADCGIDSVANTPDVEAAGRFFDTVEKEGGMPKTIVYTLNSSAYYPLATMLGNFAGGSRGKLQLGAAWWFMDHRDGIREQLRIFAATGGLGYFNGMLTDSRSFVSYARHDYFRRILCSLLGKWVESGEYPDDKSIVELAQNVSYYNAVGYFSAGDEKL